MATTALELLARQLERVTADCRRLAAENDTLWQAYELSLGNPYQHLVGDVPSRLAAGLSVTEGDERWSQESADIAEALREGRRKRIDDGVSVWCEFEAATTARLARRRPSTTRPPIPASLRRSVYERDAYRCIACGTHLDLRVDHVIPFSQGGPTVLENLQTLCEPHNRLKAARMPADWAADLAAIQREAGIA